MSIFCDGCGREITRNYVSDRYVPQRMFHGARYVKVYADIHLAVNGKWDDGDICRDCLMLVLAEGGE